MHPMRMMVAKMCAQNTQALGNKSLIISVGSIGEQLVKINSNGKIAKTSTTKKIKSFLPLLYIPD
jgi:hypothetical protein